jgi:hypothetical protein
MQDAHSAIPLSTHFHVYLSRPGSAGRDARVDKVGTGDKDGSIKKKGVPYEGTPENR